jgi:DNA polymerase III delta subunit
MVERKNPVYLFIGQDSLAKEVKIKKIKEGLLTRQTQDFNQDVLYAKELSLINFQERLLYLPLRAQKRIIVIKGAQHLKQETKDFILKYVEKPQSQVILVLDADSYDPQDEFIKYMHKCAQVFHFKEPLPLDAFALGRQINLRKTDYAVRILRQLLQNGEKPERILGGLRYSCEKDIVNPLERRRRLKFLLDCDIDIKTGMLKADFALEKLVVKLCCLSEPSG